MKKQFRKGFTVMMVLFTFSLSLIYLSCTKTDTSSTTRVKCVTCAHGGSCINDTCRCPAGYEGTGCQSEARSKFQGSWEVTETGTLTAQRTFNVTISSSFSSGSSVTNILLHDLHYNIYTSVTANVSHDSFIIPVQYAMDYNSRIQKVEGVGYIHSSPTMGKNGAITLRYYATDTMARSTDDYGYLSTTSQPSEWSRF